MLDHAIQAPKAVVAGARILNCVGISGSIWGENRAQFRIAPPEIAPEVRAIAGIEEEVSLLFVLWKERLRLGDQIRDNINRIE